MKEKINEKITLYRGNCLDEMSDIDAHSVHLILCDLPYGTTANRWDSVIDMDAMWEHYKRILKPDGCVVLFANNPFAARLINSNLDWYRYEWVWEKSLPVGFLNANRAPLRKHELVLVFSPQAPKYHPQFSEGKPYTRVREADRGGGNYGKVNKGATNENDGKRYPLDIVRYSTPRDHNHPTEKPVDLLEYIIKTYTRAGQTVLDNCMGSGSTGVACVNTDRRFVGMELDRKYYNTAAKRIVDAIKLNH